MRLSRGHRGSCGAAAPRLRRTGGPAAVEQILDPPDVPQMSGRPSGRIAAPLPATGRLPTAPGSGGRFLTASRRNR
ncbi:MAG: hypothetical protein LBE67_15280 [Kocuria palustris]|nr:hypothetical protein [Kocuria palustris]